ncbi:hypothetical protein SARC_01182, partial [Sphaeroforma arctica JP610]
MSTARSDEEYAVLKSWWQATKDYTRRTKVDEEKPCSCGLKKAPNLDEIEARDEFHTTQQKLQEFLNFVGPGWLICVAYSDPGNMYASISSGAEFGYTQIWILWWAIVFSLFVGGLCTYCAHYSDHSLSELMCCAYPMPMRIIMWLLGEITIIFTDMPEVIGFGIALNILFNWPIPVGICCSLVTTMVFLILEKMQGRYLEGIVAFFMTILGVLLIVEMAMANIDPDQMAYYWAVPTVLNGSLFSGLGIVGAVVMPHNLFLQTTSAMLRNKEAAAALLKRHEEKKKEETSGQISVEPSISMQDGTEMTTTSDAHIGSSSDISSIGTKASTATL